MCGRRWLFDPTAQNHKATFSQAFARLKPDVSVERRHERAGYAHHRDATRSRQTRRLGPDPAGRAAATHGDRGDFGQRWLILLGAVGLILLLAAVNLGTLVLSRAIERAREIAVRTALGASRLRLIRQLVVEQAVLAACGADRQGW